MHLRTASTLEPVAALTAGLPVRLTSRRCTPSSASSCSSCSSCSPAPSSTSFAEGGEKIGRCWLTRPGSEPSCRRRRRRRWTRSRPSRRASKSRRRWPPVTSRAVRAKRYCRTVTPERKTSPPRRPEVPRLTSPAAAQ